MRALRTTAALAAFAAVCLTASVSVADTVEGTRFDISERSHRVEVRLDRGHATLVVERTVSHGGDRSDQAVFFISPPESAVATRLRSAGFDSAGRPVWYEAELMEAEQAATKYHELTGIGGYYPKDPALLSWRHQGLLALQVFPVLAHASKTLEYTLEMPMHYESGRYQMILAGLGSQELAATVRLSAVQFQDRIVVNGVPVQPEVEITADRELHVSLIPQGGKRIQGALAEVPISEGKVLVHGRVNAAPRLGDIPQHAAIVVVVDTSRSARNSLPPYLTAVRGYLSHFGSAQVDLLTFDRKVLRPFGRPLGPREVIARLASLQPVAANGSQLDDAIVQADALLAQAHTSARRILVLTDLLTRSKLTPQSLGALGLKSGAILHLATVKTGPADLRRVDDEPWEILPRKTGGLYWSATSPEQPDTTTRTVFEQWARPKQLDHMVVQGLPEGCYAPDSLAEGDGLEHFVIADSAHAKVEVDGELWSRKVHYTFRPNPEENRLWSALAFGSDLYQGLSNDEQLLLARKGRAVSPVTSYLAIEPGVRPSTEGLEPSEGGLGLSGIGEGGGGRGEGIGLGSIGTLGHSDAPIDFLRDALGKAFLGCGGKGTATTSLETTDDEIVEVGAIQLSSPDPKIESCLREETWKVVLDESLFTRSYNEWSIKVSVP